MENSENSIIWYFLGCIIQEFTNFGVKIQICQNGFFGQKRLKISIYRWDKIGQKLNNGQNWKVYKIENWIKLNWKLDKIENWTKLKIAQNWKLDKIGN